MQLRESTLVVRNELDIVGPSPDAKMQQQLSIIGIEPANEMQKQVEK